MNPIIRLLLLTVFLLSNNLNYAQDNLKFNPSHYTMLFVKSVNGFTFKNNTITHSYYYEPWYSQKYNFLFDACKNVVITDNKISKYILLKNVNIKELQRINKELIIISFNKLK